MLTKGKKQNKKEKLKIHFKTGDAENLKFKNNYFDVIITKHVLYHLTDIQKGIDEIYRCLKPSGIFIITLPSIKDKPKVYKIEKIILKKYGIFTKHGKKLVNAENVDKYLSKFSKIKKQFHQGKINKPILFAKYFNTLKDFYEPQPSKALWNAVIKDVKKFVKEEKQKKGKFVEIIASGLIVATK